MEDLKRLNKFIGETGHCSRREADAIISANRVTVNGKPAELGMKVSSEDEIRIDGKLIREKTGKFVYLALNKPPGIECTTNTDVKDNIIDFLHYPTRIFPIGRLDKASEGLIFLTDDGDIVNKILRARNNHEKEYEVTVDQPVSERFIEKMGNGVPILDTVTRKCKVQATGKFTFKIILTQGLNRQIRRMCEYLGYEVVKLKRIRIINIKLDLPVGRHRELTASEIEQLNLLIEPSSKTEEASFSKGEFKRDAEFVKRDFQKKDFGKGSAGKDEAPKREIRKPDFERKNPDNRDFKKPERRDSGFPKKEFPTNEFPKRDYQSDDRDAKPKSNRETPKRNIGFIDRNDPEYRGKDEL